MSSVAKKVALLKEVSDNQRALDHLFDEYDRVRLEKENLEARLSRFVETIQFMLRTLPDGSRGEYVRRLNGLAHYSETSPKGGETYTNVIRLFQEHSGRSWTAPQVVERLEADGKSGVSPKAVANAMAYLERSGRLKRVGWGQYAIVGSGAGLINIEGPEDGTVRRSENFV